MKAFTNDSIKGGVKGEWVKPGTDLLRAPVG